MTEATPRPLAEIHTDAILLADALALIDRTTLTTHHDQAGFLAVMAMAAPWARKLADDLEEAL